MKETEHENEEDRIQQLGLDIVKSFHEQFAQNQNHHQALFVQALAILVTVLVGFGYLYVRVKLPPPKVSLSSQAVIQQPTSVAVASSAIHGTASSAKSPMPQDSPPEVNVTVETLHAFLSLSCLLLTFGIALISNMALGFRRDQAVATRIRVLSGVMPQPEDAVKVLRLKGTAFFPASFNPVDKTVPFIWMPEFHQIFLVTLFLVKVFLVLSVWANPDFRKVLIEGGFFTILMGSAVAATFAIDVGVGGWYWLKWHRDAKRAPNWLHSKSTKSETSTEASV